MGGDREIPFPTRMYGHRKTCFSTTFNADRSFKPSWKRQRAEKSYLRQTANLTSEAALRGNESLSVQVVRIRLNDLSQEAFEEPIVDQLAKDPHFNVEF